MGASDNQQQVWRQSAATLAVSALVIGAGIVLNAYLARALRGGEDAFASYQLARRLIAFVFPFTTISLGTGLTRLVAMEKSNPDAGIRILRGTLTITMLSAAVLAALAWLTPAGIAAHILPGGETQRLWRATTIWLAAYSFYLLLYSYQRGELRIHAANATNLIINAVMPLSAALGLRWMNMLDTPNFLLAWAGGMALCLPPLLLRCGNPKQLFDQPARNGVGKNISYCLPRIPAGLLLCALPYLLPLMIVKSGGNDAAILCAMLLAQMVFHLADPIGQVFLPHSAFQHSQGNKPAISRMVSETIGVSSQIGLVATGQLLVWAGILLTIWLGDEYADAAKPAVIMSAAVIPAFLFAPLRSVLDGIEEKAIVTRTLALSVVIPLAIGAALMLTGKLDATIAACLIVGYHWLNLLLLYAAVRKRLPIHAPWREIGVAAVIAIVLGGVSYALKSTVPPNTLTAKLACLAAAGVFCAVVMNLWALFAKPLWWRVIVHAVKGGGTEERETD